MNDEVRAAAERLRKLSRHGGKDFVDMHYEGHSHAKRMEGVYLDESLLVGAYLAMHDETPIDEAAIDAMLGERNCDSSYWCDWRLNTGIAEYAIQYTKPTKLVEFQLISSGRRSLTNITSRGQLLRLLSALDIPANGGR